MGEILGGFAVGALAGTFIYFIGCVIWTLIKKYKNKHNQESDVIDTNE